MHASVIISLGQQTQVHKFNIENWKYAYKNKTALEMRYVMG